LTDAFFIVLAGDVLHLALRLWH